MLMLFETGKWLPIVLKAPAFYWGMTKEAIDNTTNGIGPDNWLINLIPEKWRSTLFNMDLEEPANIHDLGYSYLSSSWNKERYLEWKKLQDRTFYENNLAAISYYRQIGRISWVEQFLANRVAWLMYTAVKMGGMKAFMKNKKMLV